LQPEVTRLMTEQDLDLRGALKAIARARGISRSEAYRLYQTEKSASR
jgi:AraC-like DNA-binding protein